MAAGFQLDPSLSGLSSALLKAKYDGADPEERKRLGFVRRATPQEFADANESHGAPADFGGPVFTSSTPPVVSDDTDSGIPVTPMPTGVSFQKQNADGRLPLNTSRPRAAEFAQPGLQTVGANMGSQPFTDAQLSDGTTLRFQGQLGPDELRAKVHGYRTKQGASQIAANPPSGVTGPRINMQESSDPLGALKRAPGMLLDAVTGSGMSGAGGLPVRPDDQGNLATAGTEATRGVQELATPGTRLRGTNRLARSMYDTASPALGPAALENPIGLAKVMGGAALGQQGASETASALGANPDQTEFAGNVGGIAGGMAGGFARAPQAAAPPERIPLWKRVQSEATAQPGPQAAPRLAEQMAQPPAMEEDAIEAARRGAPDDISAEVKSVRQADIDRRIKFGSPDDRLRAVQQNADLASPEIQDKGWQRSNDLQKRKMSQPRNEVAAPTETRKNLELQPDDFLKSRQMQRVKSGVPLESTGQPFDQTRARLAELMQNPPAEPSAPDPDLTPILRKSLAEQMAGAPEISPGPYDDVLQAMRNGTYNWKRTAR